MGRGWAGTVSRNTEPRARLFGPPRLREIRPRYAPLPVRGFGPSLSPVSREADRQRHHQDRPVGGSLRRSGNRLAVACGFTPRSLRGVAAGAEPEVRIHLPPADSLSLSRSRFRRSRTRLSARVWPAGLPTGSAETRWVFRYRVNRRQYLCRAIFQYRGAAGRGAGLNAR